MKHVHLASALAVRDGSVLLVASSYPNHAAPLWNLPGGRQQPGELLEATVLRELAEETGLRGGIVELAYVSESYDGDVHFLSAAFRVELAPTQACVPRIARDGDHVTEAAWVPVAELAARISVGVVREPLLAYLRGTLHKRYAGFEQAGITIEWPPDSA
jgi:ADP-ribose pyrophosphatase YjhB (NUDIX family)